MAFGTKLPCFVYFRFHFSVIGDTKTYFSNSDILVEKFILPISPDIGGNMSFQYRLQAGANNVPTNSNLKTHVKKIQSNPLF